jgi:hypothetical protein
MLHQAIDDLLVHLQYLPVSHLYIAGCKRIPIQTQGTDRKLRHGSTIHSSVFPEYDDAGQRYRRKLAHVLSKCPSLLMPSLYTAFRLIKSWKRL